MRNYNVYLFEFDLKDLNSKTGIKKMRKFFNEYRLPFRFELANGFYNGEEYSSCRYYVAIPREHNYQTELVYKILGVFDTTIGYHKCVSVENFNNPEGFVEYVERYER